MASVAAGTPLEHAQRMVEMWVIHLLQTRPVLTVKELLHVASSDGKNGWSIVADTSDHNHLAADACLVGGIEAWCDTPEQMQAVSATMEHVAEAAKIYLCGPVKVCWISEQSSSEQQAYHETCAPPGEEHPRTDMLIGRIQREGLEPIFCAECCQLIGYYDPKLEPVLVNQLQEMVEEGYVNALFNGYTEEEAADAVDMMDYNSSVQEQVELNDISVANVEMAVEIARNKYVLSLLRPR
jgi:hypothetical protein